MGRLLHVSIVLIDVNLESSVGGEVLDTSPTVSAREAGETWLSLVPYYTLASTPGAGCCNVMPEGVICSVIPHEATMWLHWHLGNAVFLGKQECFLPLTPPGLC